MSLDRRSFLRYGSLAAAGHLAGFGPFGDAAGMAQSSGEYKALVCIFLFGGNDSNNTLVPLNTAANGPNNYTAYANIRGPLALPENELLPLGAGVEGNYGLHPWLTSALTLFNSGNAAFLANVGTLVQPLSVAQYHFPGTPIPEGLFKLKPQQLEWETTAQGTSATTGWGGRIADGLTEAVNPAGQIPMIASVDGDRLFGRGLSTVPVVIKPGHVAAAEPAVYAPILANALDSVSPLQTEFPAGNKLAAQLKLIAEIIQVRAALGMNRQIFFAGLEGFDTETNQLGTQAEALSVLDEALGAFYAATEELGVASKVTSFTMSEFSRAFEPNANYGTNNGWGGHHLIVGGAVKGGEIYGTYPELALGGPNDAGVNGRWLPTTGMVQYAATLASWFGVPNRSLPVVFPTIGNFSTANLGFMG
jgi:uncharacterized protein (DUF1501 family)